MNGDYNLTTFNEIDSKTSGRWSREEHEKFIEGMKLSLHSLSRILI